MVENENRPCNRLIYIPSSGFQWLVYITGLLLCATLIIKYQFYLEAEKAEFIADLRNENTLVAIKINNRIGNIHQGMHTLAHLPSVDAAIENNGVLEPRDRRVVYELYNFLHSSVQLAEVYITAWRPDHFKPLIKLENPRSEHHHHTVDRPEELSIGFGDGENPARDSQAYLEIQNHLKYFAEHHPDSSNIHHRDYPALLSNQIETDDQKKHLVYSLPVFNTAGNLAGTVSTLIDTETMQRYLSNGRYVLHSPGHGLSIVPTKQGAWKTSRSWYNRNKPDPRLLYSDIIKLDIPDNGNTWYLWTGVSEEEFDNNPGVLTARFYTVIGVLVVALATLSMAFFVSTQARKRRQVEDQNLLLEKTVKQRTSDLRKSKAMAKAVLDNAADGILIMDIEGKIITANKAAQSAFHYQADEIVAIPIFKLIPDINIATLQINGNKAVDNLQTKLLTECRGVRKDGSEFTLELNFSQFIVNGDQLFTGIFRDVTDRKKYEQDIQNTKNQAEQATRAKSEFLATMSHELRTPLNAIIGYGEILQDEFNDHNHSHYQEDLNRILAAAQQLLYLVNSILDLSKIESGKMELYLERFRVLSLLQLAIDAIKPSMLKNNNHVHVQVADNYEVEADRTKLYQVILNLLNNANKFTQDGNISITVDKTDKYDIDWIELIITDTGIGMNETQLNNIFKSFTQADSSTTRRYGGTGLGLSISRHFCEMMGGTIEASSEPGKGTTFTVHLPMEVIGPKADPVKVRFTNTQFASRRSKISRVLIVGDNTQSIDLIERFLTREGFFADGANSVPQALSLARKNQPDVIVIDENSLSFDGWSSMVELKKNQFLDNIPIIMLTKSDSKQLALAMGATDFISKPIQRSSLIDIVKKHIRSRGFNQQSNNHLLVIDDDESNRTMMQRMLEAEGFSVRTADNGKTGIELITQNRPCLIFLDIMMPVMDGFEFVEVLRDNPDWRNIPVITVTGRELSSEEQNRLRGQVESIISKDDLEPAGLLQKMREVVVNVLRQERPMSSVKRNAG